MSDDDMEYLATLQAAAAGDSTPQEETAIQSAPASPMRNEEEPEGFKVNDFVQHNVHKFQGRVVQLGLTSAASWHQGKVCVEYEKQVSIRKKQTVQRWCLPIFPMRTVL